MSLKNFHLRVNSDLELKVPSNKDAEAIIYCVNVSRARLEKYMIWADKTKTKEDALKFINSNEYQSVFDKDFPLCIWYKNNIVGIAGFNNGDKINKTLDLGYWISNEYSGIGIVTKACQALINFAFSMTITQTIFIKCEVTNKRSYAIAQRLGFEFVKQEKGACYLKDGKPEMLTYKLQKK
ncbi:MAG: GNAT family N-acetyltransferase [Chitinophagales bacterium]